MKTRILILVVFVIAVSLIVLLADIFYKKSSLQQNELCFAYGGVWDDYYKTCDNIGSFHCDIMEGHYEQCKNVPDVCPENKDVVCLTDPSCNGVCIFDDSIYDISQ